MQVFQIYSGLPASDSDLKSFEPDGCCTGVKSVRTLKDIWAKECIFSDQDDQGRFDGQFFSQFSYIHTSQSHAITDNTQYSVGARRVKLLERPLLCPVQG